MAALLSVSLPLAMIVGVADQGDGARRRWGGPGGETLPGGQVRCRLQSRRASPGRTRSIRLGQHLLKFTRQVS